MRVFCDTMVYLHYARIDQMDLAGVLGCSTYRIVVPRITIRELDRQKNVSQSSRIRERARHILKKLEEWAPEAEIRPGITVEFLQGSPSVDFESFGLNPTWNDDVLIASMLSFQQAHPSEPMVLITEDTGPRLTALNFNLTVHRPPPKFKLPDEPDPLEAENRSLLKRLVKLEGALPKLVAGFSGSEVAHARFVLRAPPGPMEQEIARRLADLRARLPMQAPPAESPNAGFLSGIQIALNQFAGIDGAEYTRFNSEVERYFGDYEQYLRDTWDVQTAKLLTIEFVIAIRNTGSAPAEDVDVTLHFPDGMSLYDEDSLPPCPEEPSPPRRPRTKLEILSESLSAIQVSSMRGFASPLLPRFPSEGDVRIKKTNSYDIAAHYERIKHGDVALLEKLYLTFESYETARPFECRYELRPANLPEAVTGALHFVIEPSQG